MSGSRALDSSIRDNCETDISASMNDERWVFPDCAGGCRCGLRVKANHRGRWSASVPRWNLGIPSKCVHATIGRGERSPQHPFPETRARSFLRLFLFALALSLCGCQQCPPETYLVESVRARAMAATGLPRSWQRVVIRSGGPEGIEMMLMPSGSGWITRDGEVITYNGAYHADAELGGADVAEVLSDAMASEEVEGWEWAGAYLRASEGARAVYERSLAGTGSSDIPPEVAEEIVALECSRALRSAADLWRPWSSVKRQLEATHSLAIACSIRAEGVAQIEEHLRGVGASIDIERRIADMGQDMPAAMLRVLSQVSAHGEGRGRGNPTFMWDDGWRDDVWSRENVRFLEEYWDSPAKTRILAVPDGRAADLVTVGQRVQKLAFYLSRGMVTTKAGLRNWLR